MDIGTTIDSYRGEKAPESFKAPHTFLPTLTFISAVSAVVILAFTGFGVWSVVSHYVIRFAETSSVNISAALSSSERESFFTETLQGQRTVVREIPSDRLEEVDARIERNRSVPP